MIRPLHLLLVAGLLKQAAGMDRATADSLVLRAQQAYEAGDHRTALALYDSVAQVFTSADLEHNRGNCWYKLGDLGKAILHYERAVRLAPGDAGIRANLDLARQQVADRIDAAPGLFVGSGWLGFMAGRDVDSWARRALWAWLAVFVLLGVSLFVRTRPFRRFLQGSAAAVGLVTVLFVALAASRSAQLRDDTAAIIMHAKVDVRSEPSERGTVLFVLHRGTKVAVQRDTEGWCEVRLPNGNTGWMPAGAIERI